MSARKILVTGGSGFIGSALVRRLVRDGHSVRVLDDNSRGSPRRLTEVQNDIDFVSGDVRDPRAVDVATRGMDEVHHLAYVNGTEFFYSAPEMVLDVGVKGMMNVLDSCRKHDIGALVLASSSEVYQTPTAIPTDETAPLIVPDVLNPRYSYGGGKIISELMAINYGRKFFDRVLIFRPHNVYGPDMGWEHVVPQFALRLKAAVAANPSGPLPFAIQGSGVETRSFCFVDDLVEGVIVMRAKGQHLGIYHVGTTDEISVAELARQMGQQIGREIGLQTGPRLAGSTPRRCPDISKLSALGYMPSVPLAQGLATTIDWYWKNDHLMPRGQA
jgi:nucleoside-diphosphate-sugar epimerase